MQDSCPSRSNSAAVDSSPTLRNKKDVILEFVDRVSASGEINEGRRAYVDAQRPAKLDAIIVVENSQPEATRTSVDHAFRNGAVPTADTKILPPVSRFPQAVATASRSNVRSPGSVCPSD